MKNIYLFCLLLLQIMAAKNLSAQTADWQGQCASWGHYVVADPQQSHFGLRFIPELSIEKSLCSGSTLNSECALHAYGWKYFSAEVKHSIDGKIKPYRLWIRFTTAQFEVRAGLQKINFGSATLLRPLMWFDRIDPRDPLQLTDGVYGLLLQYYSKNNSNLWFWGLYGNDRIKGWEIMPTADGKIEYGGRLQLPLPRGEIGFSSHIRQIDLSKGLMGDIPLGNGFTSEQRLAVDGKWDIGVGLWLEGAFVHQRTARPDLDYQTMMTIGADYTFAIGNGLYLLLENLFLATGPEALSADENDSFSALSLNYPFGILDNLTAMIYYNWENADFYRFCSWKRSYDRWQIFFMFFCNPRPIHLFVDQKTFSAFVGKGLQLMVVYNY